MNKAHKPQWPRVIILMDMNAFFAAIEQRDCPEWRGLPIAITNGLRGTTIITCSYEARAYGVKTGMRLNEARTLCENIIQCPANPKKYAAVSTAIMSALETHISPDIEVFSVDEAFLEVTHCQSLLGTPREIAQLTKDIVFSVSGLPCSVGVSGDKTTAKWAAKQNKPDGLTIVPPWEAEHTLHAVPVTDLCGINKGIGRFLAAHGVHVCGDMKKLPISVLARRFGNPGRRIWYMAQGKDPEPLCTEVAAPKSLGHGKVVPPNTTDKTILRTYLLHMSAKVAARLRRHELEASRYYVGIRTAEGWINRKSRVSLATQSEKEIMVLCDALLNGNWQGQGIFQVQVTALDPKRAGCQKDLFDARTEKTTHVLAITDKINGRYGEFTLASARLLNRSDMPNVIAPAWKPSGHRQTI